MSAGTWDQKVYIYVRSAPKGRQQMGETGFCEILRFSAVSCENLQFPAVFCENLRPPNPFIYRASRKSAKICKNLRKCAFRVRFLPFAVSLLARPDMLFFSSMNVDEGRMDVGKHQEPLHAPFLNGLFSSGFSRGKTAP